jgi:argininosuccinate lyase
VNHTHEGSIGNLCNPEIEAMMEEILGQFNFEKTKVAIDKLLA